MQPIRAPPPFRKNREPSGRYRQTRQKEYWHAAWLHRACPGVWRISRLLPPSIRIEKHLFSVSLEIQLTMARSIFGLKHQENKRNAGLLPTSLRGVHVLRRELIRHSYTSNRA